MGEPVADADDVLVRFQKAGLQGADRWLIRGLDFALRRGEIVTLIGPNGSGKSTTAKLAVGIEQPTEGSVERKDGLRVAYVPQKIIIDWTLPLTVRRFMTLTGALSDTAIMEAVEATGIADLLTSPVQTLSGGEFQRVLLARAIARKPDLLVLDEPVQGVDYAGETLLYDLINSIRESLGCGVLLISHDLHVVMASTDWVICLNGHICCQGPPSVVSASEDYGQLFGKRGEGSLALYRHEHDHSHHADGSVCTSHDHDHAHRSDNA